MKKRAQQLMKLVRGCTRRSLSAIVVMVLMAGVVHGGTSTAAEEMADGYFIRTGTIGEALEDDGLPKREEKDSGFVRSTVKKYGFEEGEVPVTADEFLLNEPQLEREEEGGLLFGGVLVEKVRLKDSRTSVELALYPDALPEGLSIQDVKVKADTLDKEREGEVLALAGSEEGRGVAASYDIAILDKKTKEEIQPLDYADIYLPLPEWMTEENAGEVVVYHAYEEETAGEDGRILPEEVVEELDAEVVEGMLTFEADSLGSFVVTSDEVPETGSGEEIEEDQTDGQTTDEQMKDDVAVSKISARRLIGQMKSIELFGGESPMGALATLTGQKVITAKVRIDNQVPDKGPLTFGLYDGENKLVTTVTSDDTGEIKIDVKASGLEAGTYKLKEAMTEEEKQTYPDMTPSTDVMEITVRSVMRRSPEGDWLNEMREGRVDHFMGYGGTWDNIQVAPGGDRGKRVNAYCMDPPSQYPDLGRRDGSSRYRVVEVDPTPRRLREATTGSTPRYVSPQNLYERNYEEVRRYVYYFTRRPPVSFEGSESRGWDAYNKALDYVLNRDYRGEGPDERRLRLVDLPAAEREPGYDPGDPNFHLVLLWPDVRGVQPLITGYFSWEEAVAEYEETVFNNTRATTVTLSARKTVDGASPGPDRYSFQLIDERGTIKYAQNDADGNVTFELSLGVGIHKYYIKESPGTNNEMNYDTRVYLAVVEVNESLESRVTYRRVGSQNTTAGRYYGYNRPLMTTANNVDIKATYVVPKEDFDQLRPSVSHPYFTDDADIENIIGRSEVAYCFDKRKEWPPTLSLNTNVYDYDRQMTIYNRIQDAETEQLRGETEIQSFDKSQIATVLLNGYPHNLSNIMEGTEVTEQEFRAATQLAIWYFTNSYEPPVNDVGQRVYNAYERLIESEIDTGLLHQIGVTDLFIPETQNSRFQPLISAGSAAVGNETPVFQNKMRQNSGEIRITAKKMYRDSAGTALDLEGGEFRFLLKGGDEEVLAEAFNDSYGDVLFELTPERVAGISTFYIEEDTAYRGQGGFDYDEVEYDSSRYSLTSDVLATGEVTLGAPQHAVSVEPKGNMTINNGKGYCYNYFKEWPSGSEGYIYRGNAGDGDLNAYSDVDDSTTITRAQLSRVLYNGYPYDKGGLSDRYHLTDEMFRVATQYAVWVLAEDVQGEPNPSSALYDYIEGVLFEGEQWWIYSGVEHERMIKCIADLTGGEFALQKGTGLFPTYEPKYQGNTSHLQDIPEDFALNFALNLYIHPDNFEGNAGDIQNIISIGERQQGEGIEFTNRRVRDLGMPTGITLQALPYVLLTLLGAVAALALMIKRKRLRGI